MQLEALASPSLNVKNYLVMATTSQSQVLKSAYQTYRHCGLAGCILISWTRRAASVNRWRWLSPSVSR